MKERAKYSGQHMKGKLILGMGSGVLDYLMKYTVMELDRTAKSYILCRQCYARIIGYPTHNHHTKFLDCWYENLFSVISGIFHNIAKCLFVRSKVR